jgi:hypothetical protein
VLFFGSAGQSGFFGVFQEEPDDKAQESGQDPDQGNEGQ